MSIVDRNKILDDVMKYKGFTKKKELAEFLGIKSNALSNWYSRNSIDHDMIKEKIPELSYNWLLTGDGNMLDDSSEVAEETPIYEYEEKYRDLKEKHILLLERSLKIMEENIRLLEEKNTKLKKEREHDLDSPEPIND